MTMTVTTSLVGLNQVSTRRGILTILAEDEDEDSDMNSDGTAEPLEDRFVDLTTKSTPVESKVDVIKYVTMNSWWVVEFNVTQCGDPLTKVSIVQSSYIIDLIGLVGYLPRRPRGVEARC
jgi:hypothetical protein